MLWEKKTSIGQKFGYLYLRETIYIRDKRTIRKKRNPLNPAKNQRAKYSKKKDIYCGKIEEITLKIPISFNEYIEIENKDYLKYKLENSFEDILDDYVNYLLYIHQIEKNLYETKKIAFKLANSYLSKETINFIKRFELRGNSNSFREIQRFANRCEDAGIFDLDIIMLLYIKRIPNKKEAIKLKEEIDLLSKEKLQSICSSNLREFIKKNKN